MLNVFDPVTPDRGYRLDLRRFEQREFAKILIELAVVEPGRNWVNESFRWSKYDEPIPGWELPNAWTLPDDDTSALDSGPRKHGWLILEYTSTGEDCAPVYPTRRQLRKKTLVGTKRVI